MKFFDTLEEAWEAAEEMWYSLETVVFITLEENGMYALFGNGELVEKVGWKKDIQNTIIMNL